jgi:hypothetical protein
MTDRVTIPLRIAPELHARLKELAARDQRSLNTFIGRALSHFVARAVPSSGHAPAPVPILQRLPVPSKVKKVRPNEQCPCGSGSKYKRCHGRA